MKRFYSALIGALVLSTIVSAAAPAFALGGCGPNRHRGFYGRCVFGGQNQGSCLRRTGHLATRMPNGNLVCL